MTALAEARERRTHMPTRQVVPGGLADHWTQVTETVHWIVADRELADRLLVALANLAPPSVELAEP